MSSLPLAGVRIIDLSHSWAAPHCTRILADFGAEVIRVEYVRRLCPLRGGKKENQAYNRHPMWFQVNRNKLSVTLDLKLEKDREILRDLVKISDALIENARGGVMAGLGFSYQDLVKIKKNLVVISMASFGNTGPYASYAGYGATIESVGGIQNLTAYKKGEKPHRVREMDVTAGVVGACAVMTGLLHRQRTGEGQYIDVSQLEAATHGTIGDHLLEYSMNGNVGLPLGNRHWKFAPQGCYRCKGDDKWLTLTIRSDEEWQSFCRVVGSTAWKSDPRFAGNAGRVEHHDELDRLIEGWTVSQDQYEALHALQQAGIAAGAVLSPADLSHNRHLQERDYFMKAEDGTESIFMGMPFRLSEGKGRIRWRGPDLGKHNRYVICDLLGRHEKDIPEINEDLIGTAFDSE